ncbi:MAG TPA: malto-oligosyltrehalose trehalohydrolase [Vicinamibacterales bacterium]|nr:malto-oligosyltrehalose trehalohydrolase [Vicinamibacterales bacterium]
MIGDRFGALPLRWGVRFRVWAPSASRLTLVLQDGRAAGSHEMARDAQGVFDAIVAASAGDRYGYRVDNGELRPDPASRFQPDGVHGLSQVIDPSAFTWSDDRWRNRPAGDRILYELHIGTFTPDGTFAAATAKLEAVRDTGVTVLEIMPVVDFAGSRNWGYDGVCLFAPSRAYGHPDELRRLVDRAHHLGLAVVFDVVYNHLGPEGAYLTQFNKDYFTSRRSTPWGDAVNLDGPCSPMVRHYLVENAVHWIDEYHADGLRLDATHALVEADDGAILREIAAHVRASTSRRVFIDAEDHRNLAAMVDDPARGGWGLDGVWADDFHHVMRRLLHGDRHGYYADFAGTTSELAATIQRGWLFTGQPSPRRNAPRGTDPSAIPMQRFIVCLQNHDQIGNRPRGDRLNHVVAPESWRAASVLLLTVPMTPLIFMGQEWAASTPFQFFTDLEPALGVQVTEGRRREFAEFPEFSTATGAATIPDPQAHSTFEASRLRWDERTLPPHSFSLDLYRTLMTLRLDHPALGASSELQGEAVALDDDTIAMRRAEGDDVFWIVARFRTPGSADLGQITSAHDKSDSSWRVVLTTEDPLFAPDPRPPMVDLAVPTIRFERAGAVILKRM